jgi:transketolase
MVSEKYKRRGRMKLDKLKSKALDIRKRTILIHSKAQDSRIASSLSCVDILTVLFYGRILKYKKGNPLWEHRDRLIISKGHGSICFYPILADIAYISEKEIGSVCTDGSRLGSIPDAVIPGYETINGSLGHGLGVGCGISLALKTQKRKERVFVLMGDGELNEGAVWEAVMLASEKKFDNLILIIDNNKISMLDYCKNIINLEPLQDKFRAFNWKVYTANGHDVNDIKNVFMKLLSDKHRGPKVIIADTVKGKGVNFLENDPLCHIKNIKPDMIKTVLENINE